ncbi:MAG TPA: glycine betaine ABC transporter substrate-binding protein [Polyangiaceae bacterium]|nr:glycine betaine ABC transporter substrate-binding protein [Polyangiaceae bacterium]
MSRAGVFAGLFAGVVVACLALAPPALAGKPVVIGSKAFAESWILGDAIVGLIERAGAGTAVHRKNLGGTEIAYQALAAASIDVYPEYTGTIAEVILKTKGAPSADELRRALAPLGLGMSAPLGFNDGYALAVTASTAQKERLRSISDLDAHPDLRFGFTHEFLGRGDGWPGLLRHYGLEAKNVRGLQHELAYEAIGRGQLDVTDIYTTDPQIERLELVLLADDRAFFPRYDAVLLYRLDLGARAPAALLAMGRLEGKIDEASMTRANSAVVLRNVSTEEAARQLVDRALGRDSPALADPPAFGGDLARNLVRHVELVGVSLALAILIGVPLGIAATRSRPVAFITLTGAGLLQTIPSLALLAFLIPLFGIGIVPALVALFIYSLLPIVRSTYTGLATIPSSLTEAADGIGLSARTKLLQVTLPMASPSILSGIKTSAVINVGTATLAALIGAEGLGNPIMQGIALRDTRLILQGAVPAALLAIAVEALFSLAERVVVPRGLRLSSRAR